MAPIPTIDRYLRTLLIHGARAVVCRATTKTDSHCRWVSAIRQRRGFLKACVAVANKNARIAWVLMMLLINVELASFPPRRVRRAHRKDGAEAAPYGTKHASGRRALSFSTVSLMARLGDTPPPAPSIPRACRPAGLSASGRFLWIVMSEIQMAR